MSIDKYFARTYNAREYNCAHLVVEVWSDLFGPQLGEMLRSYLCAPSQRKSVLSHLRLGRWLQKPEDPCVILFRAPKQATHVGLWLQGKVLHITPQGVQYQPLEIVRLGHPKVRFFTCK